ncbi:MAG TPA: hypothetical protein VIY73_28380 [Polyangiaceae bacterium]
MSIRTLSALLSWVPAAVLAASLAACSSSGGSGGATPDGGPSKGTDGGGTAGDGASSHPGDGAAPSDGGVPSSDGGSSHDGAATDGAGGGEGGDGGDGGSALPPLPAGTGTGTTYYVSPTGSDANAGTSAASPWQTLGKVTSTTFQPGDSVLLEGGSTFTGCPVFSGTNIKSTAAAPFTLGSYGTGRFTLTASCSAAHSAALSISGVNGFVLRDGILAGNQGGAEYGVWINNPTSSTTDYVRVQSCDISGFYAPSGTDYGAEVFVDGIPGGLDHVMVLACALHGASGKASPDDNGIAGYGNGENITNALYQGNTVYDIGGKAGGANGSEGNGILANGVDGGVIQYNVVHDCGGNSSTCGGPAGIWAYAANAVTMQFNEVYASGPAGAAPSGACDWNAYDIDGLVTNSTLQYNYAHDNTGAGYLAYISGTWSGNTIRFNIGQGDGSEVTIAGYQATASDLAIYDNTFYASKDLFTVGVAGGGTIAGTVADNVFYATGTAQLVNALSWNTATVTGVDFLGNDYYSTGTFGITWGGTSYTSLGAWSSAANEETQGGKLVGLNVDPMLANPGSGGTIGGYDPSALAGYALKSGSPLVGTGIDLKKAANLTVGAQDYFGNPVPNGVGTGYDVGAYGGH